MARNRDDLLIIGGGLAGALTALAVREKHPDLKMRIVERGDTLGGNHLWSFFGGDVAKEDRSLVDPMIAAHWPRHEVRFPAHERVIDQTYSSIASERLDAVVRDGLGDDAVVQGDVTGITPDSVTLASGERLEADAVIDARGLSGAAEGLDVGYQKFVGRMLSVTGGHGVAIPTIMDATVSQADGYRFVYLLPFSETEIFVEDTYYHDVPELDAGTLTARIDHYAKLRGWDAHPAGRLEAGVLPVVKNGDFETFWPKENPVARIGVRGGFFHPLTSYSLPDAVRTARAVADALPADGHALAAMLRKRAKAHWKSHRGERLLSRMLFDGAGPAERYRVLERFYRLPADLIGRFYAGRPTAMDWARILTGKPPIPLFRGVRIALGIK